MTEPSRPCSTARFPAGEAWREALLGALERMQEPGHGHRFVLLRETPLDAAALDAGDIDLLGTRASVDALLAHLDVSCRELELNLFVERTGPRKTRVSLCSPDLAHELQFDLWTDLWQLDGGRRSLRWRDVAPLCRHAPAGFARMPLRLEAAVYVEHLRAKRKDLGSAGVRRRLEHYAAALHAASGTPDELGAELSAVAAAAPAALPAKLLGLAVSTLEHALGRRHRWRTPWRRLEDALRRARSRLERPPPGARAVALVGPDGIGKSTVGKALVASDAGWDEYVLGKALYRRSLLFRGIYKLNRGTGARLSQERIDEALAGLAFPTAVLRLRRRLAAARDRALVIDRFAADFLYVGRKADRARFSRWGWLASLLYVSLPVVHMTAPYAVLSGRKQEISEAGLLRYERDMTRFYTRRSRVCYLRFANHGTAEEAVRLLGRQLAERGQGAGS